MGEGEVTGMDGQIFVGKDLDGGDLAFANLRDNRGNDFTIKMIHGKLIVERLEILDRVPVWSIIFQTPLAPAETREEARPEAGAPT